MHRKNSSKEGTSRRRVRTSSPNKHNHIGRTCKAEGKKMYRFTDAEQQARQMRRDGDTSHHVYVCMHCHYCHIGRNSKKAK